MLGFIEHDDQVNVVNRPDVGATGQAARWDNFNDIGSFFSLSMKVSRRDLASRTRERIPFDRSAEGLETVV